MRESATEVESVGVRDFRVRDVLVCPDRNLIVRDGETVRIEPRVMEILVLLAQRQGSTIGREELRERLWSAHVTDDAIHRAVWKLRRALGAARADLIETVAKRGYRLAVAVVPVTERRDTPSRAWWLGAAAAAATLAVGLAVSFAGFGTAPGDAVDAGLVETVPLTALAGYESRPVISPDGARVVFQHFAKSGDGAAQWDLYAMPLVGGRPRRLTSSPAHELEAVWSPTGDRLAFVRSWAAGCDVVVRSLSGGEERVVDDCGVPRRAGECCPTLAWLADGEHLLVATRRAIDEPLRVYATALADGSTRMLTDPPAQWLGDRRPVLSGDGRRLAFVRARSEAAQDVWVLDLEDGRERRVTFDDNPLQGVSWTVDDAALLVASNRTGTYLLWRADLESGELAPVGTVGMNATSPVVAPDGSATVYEEWKSEINIWELMRDPDGSVGARPLIESSRWDWRPQLSPGGDRIAFLSNRDGGTDLWLAADDGSGERRLTEFGIRFAGTPRWSPTGDELVLAVPRAGNLDVIAVDPESRSRRWLTADASEDRAPVYSRDGRHVYFSSNRGGEWQVWRVARDGGPAEPVKDAFGIAAQEAIDGGGLWLLRPSQPGLRYLPFDGAAAERVIEDFVPTAPMDWQVSELGIWYTRWDEAGNGVLVLVDPASGAQETVTAVEGSPGLLPEYHYDSAISVSADGRRILLSSIDHSDSDLWVSRRADS